MSSETEIQFFRRLIDGAENSNHAAETALKSAYSSLHPSQPSDVPALKDVLLELENICECTLRYSEYEGDQKAVGKHAAAFAEMLT